MANNRTPGLSRERLKLGFTVIVTGVYSGSVIAHAVFVTDRARTPRSKRQAVAFFMWFFLDAVFLMDILSIVKLNVLCP